LKIVIPYTVNEELRNVICQKIRVDISGFDMTLKQKAYYRFLRFLIPPQIRKIIQNNIGRKVNYKKNFIHDEIVKIIIDNTQYNGFSFNNNNSAVILTHDVETQKGFNYIPALIDLENKYNLKSCFNIVPYKYRIDKRIIRIIEENNFEIGIHGFNHDGKLYMSEKIFNERAKYINEALHKYNAVGFRSPMVHRNLNWLQKLDITYDSSCFDYDPFQPFPGGTGMIWPFIAGKIVELPYTIPQDHTLFYVLKVDNIDIWKNKIDWITKNNGMVLVLTHPDYLLEKKNIKYYETLLEYICSLKNTWFCLPKEMSTWIMKKLLQD